MSKVKIIFLQLCLLLTLFCLVTSRVTAQPVFGFSPENAPGSSSAPAGSAAQTPEQYQASVSALSQQNQSQIKNSINQQVANRPIIPPQKIIAPPPPEATGVPAPGSTVVLPPSNNAKVVTPPILKPVTEPPASPPSIAVTPQTQTPIITTQPQPPPSPTQSQTYSGFLGTSPNNVNNAPATSGASEGLGIKY